LGHNLRKDKRRFWAMSRPTALVAQVLSWLKKGRKNKQGRKISKFHKLIPKLAAISFSPWFGCQLYYNINIWETQISLFLSSDLDPVD